MKPIDLLKMQITIKCEYCITDKCTGDGISLITCSKNKAFYLYLTATNAEPCTPDDWSICPLNQLAH